MKRNSHLEVDLNDLPGHYARRIHQIAVALFTQEMGDINVTPVQYSSLQAICKSPGIDQGTLARTIGFDTSTIGSVIDRLESRGLVRREVSPTDKRVRQVTATAEGEQLLAKVVPPMLRSQALFLEPLPPKDRKELMRLMHKLIEAHAA
ncbi:MarR family winged helix-turn-helix transcriptional regulator [Hydrogenophaga palleronii]|uniref:MarR family winged helix-turn-helix transcriptional regulator n=1 Tax=Hydrogenophaga palleronii TaxID=65655 RepID=UPI0008260D10|nr:MarR family winged helix-turn-helix transcriptional regulator [Hydrogenophaga palleronii]